MLNGFLNVLMPYSTINLMFHSLIIKSTFPNCFLFSVYCKTLLMTCERYRDKMCQNWEK